MRAKATYSPLPARTSLFALALICSSSLALSSLLTPNSWAQEIDFQTSIDSSSEALIELDVMASDCLAALDAGEESEALCDSFIDAIDGELMANYLEQCRVLKSWRDQYVDQTVSLDLSSSSEDNEEMLRRLIAIEYSCGENTLQERTQFVFSAFNRLRNNPVGGTATTTTLSRQTNQRRFDALDSAERQRLQNSLQNQQNRSLRESERQFNDLENELIRQQIQNPIRTN